MLVFQHFSGFLFFSGYKLATSGGIFVAILCCRSVVNIIGYFGLLVGVQMTVGVPAGFHPFMAQAVSQYHGRAANVDQQGGVGMPHIMHTDLLSAGVVTAVFHLSADLQQTNTGRVLRRTLPVFISVSNYYSVLGRQNLHGPPDVSCPTPILTFNYVDLVKYSRDSLSNTYINPLSQAS